jgi:hypothetical protein
MTDPDANATERPDRRDHLVRPEALTDDGAAEEEPRATLVLTLLYLIVLAGIWWVVYQTLLQRAG